MPGFPQQTGSKSERKLCKFYRSLNESDALTLMKFAEFLSVQIVEPNETVSAAETALSPDTPFPEPKEIPAPENENVIKAIKRVSEMYYMVDRSTMLDVTSGLMTEHLMQGRPAVEVIADLKSAFHKEYVKLCDKHKDDNKP